MSYLPQYMIRWQTGSFVLLWVFFLSSLETTVTATDTLTSNDAIQHAIAKSQQHPHNLIESMWKSFKQTLETTATSLKATTTMKHGSVTTKPSSSSQVQAETVQKQRQQQRELLQQRQDMLNKRTLLFDQSLSEHYSQLISQTFPSIIKDDITLPSTMDAVVEQGTPVKTSSYKPDSKKQPLRPLRWRRKQHSQSSDTTAAEKSTTYCYCFAESSTSYWSFEWCPTEYITQGRRDSNGQMQPLHLLGRFTDNIGKHQNSQSANNVLARVLMTISQSMYPHNLGIELYRNGDQCDDVYPVDDITRVAVVIYHDASTSDLCPDDIEEDGKIHGDSEWMIQSIDEPRPCQYVLHICQFPFTTRSSKSTANGIDAATTSSEPKAKRYNQTLLATQQVIETFRRKTQADVHAKSAAQVDVVSSLHTALPPMPSSMISAKLKLVKDMFQHAYDSYMYHGYPAPEVRPVTCKPATFDLVKIPGLTLIDSLDTLLIMGNYTEFARAVERLRYLHHHMAEEVGMYHTTGGLFSINQNVSVFETNIRVLGGLLSAHQLADAFLNGKVLNHQVYAPDGTVMIGEIHAALECQGLAFTTDASKGLVDTCDGLHSVLECKHDTVPDQQLCHNETANMFWVYDGFLLDLARDIGDRLLPAFTTQTGIPFGTVNLLSGIPKGETPIASLAGGGTLSLEMEQLGRMTGEENYGRAAKLAVRALWMRRSSQDLLGKHICSRRGEWTESLSGIGSNSDSFYEYLMKHHTLFPEDTDFWLQLLSTYAGVYKESRLGEWYADVDMRIGAAVSGGSRQILEALMAFYPGLQVLLGEVTPAARSLNSFFLVREYLGFLPERFNYALWKVDSNGGKHLLRPELLESAYFQHRATKGLRRQRQTEAESVADDSSGWQWAGAFAIDAIEKVTRTQCGYASPRDVSPSNTGTVVAEKRRVRLSNEMPSYFMSETLKYLYLLFDEKNILHEEELDWVFTTEAHPFRYEQKSASDLDQQKNSLRQILEKRIKNGDEKSQRRPSKLEEEKWTHTSDLKSFLHQLDILEVEEAEAYDGRRIADSLSEEDDLPSSMFENFVPVEMMSGEFDNFNERLELLSPAHSSLRSLGNEVELTMACPNIHQSKFLWISALNGGIIDYSDIYMSRVHDKVNVLGVTKAYVGSIDALALLGSGVHVNSIFDASSKCQVRHARDSTVKDASDFERKKQKSSSPMLHGASRFDMDSFGTFEVSGLTQGSGFFIQHVETGESLVTTLIGSESYELGPETYVLVYNSVPTHDSTRRSVVMADLNENAYTCTVEIIENVENDEPFCEREDIDGDADEEEYARSLTMMKKTIAQFPCAPAMFGPTQLASLKEFGDITVDARIQPPIISEEYGCIPRHNINETPSSAEHEGESDFDTMKEEECGLSGDYEDNNVCANEVVTMVYRGICTFQEKSMNQKSMFNAKGVIVINSEDEELFVMSGEPFDFTEKCNDFPVTVLVTGSDGQAILDIFESFETDGKSHLTARISLVGDRVEVTKTESGLRLSGNKFWPGVRATPDALQIYSAAGWGVHGTQRQRSANSDATEWQLLLMPHISGSQ